MSSRSLLAFALLWVCAAPAAAARAVSYPHLALSSDPTRMFIQWTSAQGPVTEGGAVQWGASASSLPHAASATNWTWSDPSTSRKYTFNHGEMSGLTPGATVFFRVGSADGWSATTSFVATRTDFSEDKPLVIAWLGDLGVSNAQALPFLLKDAAAGVFDHFVHVGDYAYDLLDSNGAVGDAFQLSIEPITSTSPYMGCEGNHEGAQAFGHYTNRFSVFASDNSSGVTPTIPGVLAGMPNNHWYTYTVGPVFFAVMSTEAYFSYSSGVPVQYAFLDAQLAQVDRSVTPWVIVYGHRSIYCSCDGDCDSAATTVRLGPKGDGVYGMETLFNKHKVDIWINGHEHDYERNYPTYQGKLATPPASGKPGGTAANPEVILNPTAPIYIVEGCAGDKEHHEPFTRAQPKYSAFRSNTYGYSKMTVYNASHLLFEQRMTDDEFPNTGSVIDAMLLINLQH